MAVDVSIHAFDNLNCRIECDAGIAFEIYEHFSFYVPDYKFMPKYKAGIWDGKIKMFDLRTRSFPNGLVPRLRKWLESNDYTCSVEDGIFFSDELDDSSLVDLWKSSKFPPRDYQLTAIVKALRRRNCLLLAPTGSGKSYIAYSLVRYLLDNQEGKILITVPNIQLAEQLLADFEDYSVGTWKLETEVQTLHSGKTYDPDIRILISTWQSVYKKPKEWFSGFNVFICDEAHGADSSSITSIVNKIPNAEYRIGLTGTLDGSMMHELEMLARFGEMFRVATSHELMEKGTLADLSIQCYHLIYPQEDRKKAKKFKYLDEIDFIIENQQRNEFMCRTACEQTGNVLMLFNFIEKHGVILESILNKMAKEYGREVYYIDGSIDVKTREAIRNKMETQNNCILLATYGTLSTGINVVNLDCLVLGHPFKGMIRNLQSIGRVLRTSKTKQKAKVIDFADDLTYNKPNALFEHFIKRLETYSAERFEYKVEKIHFEEKHG